MVLGVVKMNGGGVVANGNAAFGMRASDLPLKTQKRQTQNTRVLSSTPTQSAKRQKHASVYIAT
jgi:hypothetical protein